MGNEKLEPIGDVRDNNIETGWESVEAMGSQEDNMEANEDAGAVADTEKSRDNSHLQLGAKVLTGAGFHDRHKEIVSSSLAKETARGEKFAGKPGERRNMAYISRLEKMIEKHGNALEQRLWNASAEKLIIRPEDIEENYWKAQEQVLRDNGHGNVELSDYLKQEAVEDIQKQQRASLESWSNYLGDEQAPYPMWFKVYAWDGMSKMGVFDKGKGEFRKRNEHTVAPYPHLNPAALAKVYGVISDFYADKNNADFAEDDKLEALVKSGNFNRLYSKFLLDQKVIMETPERTKDVHGEWKEYLPGQEEDLAFAAEGTPWCIANHKIGRSYLGDEDGYYDEENERSNKAKFILFHLQDPETGEIADNACASIRLNTYGNVAEISGLKEGQALEDSLLSVKLIRLIRITTMTRASSSFAIMRSIG